MINEVTNEDCMAMMARYPDRFFDLAIVDPPYGIGDFTRSTSRGKKVERNYGRATWNDNIPHLDFFDELKRVSKNRIIWGANYYNCFESGAIVWDKGNNHPDMSRCEIASNSLNRLVKYFNLFWAGYSEPNRIHPCQKPIDLYRYCLQFASAGDKILDTHLGSGSSRIAAYLMGFDFWATELDPDYFQGQERRFKEQTAQGSLFNYQQSA